LSIVTESLAFAPTGAGATSRTHVARGGCDEAPWELWQRRPPGGLAGLVPGLWAGSSPNAFARHRTLPNGELTLMLHLGPPQRLVERDGAPCDELRRAGFIAGLQERPATFECLEAHTRVAAVRLSPLGGWVLFGGVPQVELTGQVLEPDAVLGPRSGIESLRQRMLEATDLGVALDLLETWLLGRLRAARTPHGATRSAIRLLAGSTGGFRVDALARETGVSPRRLHELFLREVGVPAKRLSRIVRFRHTLERLATAPSVDLAQLALECGYYDQSHLYRDFRDLATMTPLDYLVAHGEGLDGVDVLSG
jgi:AraC-like DNA-binding protein